MRMDKIFEYALRKEEFVKRTAFALMATYAVHAKNDNNEIFEQFLPITNVRFDLNILISCWNPLKFIHEAKKRGCVIST